ncbi:hypothetical protein ACHAXA_009801 [Cyclostephanos tholiformis]|uniref:Uncharacterized protein n=1 Tax=Cyclostephanos tholiformis TaxID=382380 RepID=A0ABD3R6R3_9STRA
MRIFPPRRIMPLPGRSITASDAASPEPPQRQRSVSVGRKKPNTMLENASAEELSVLVLTIQDEYAKLSKEKALADETINSLNQQYKDAIDEICSISSRVHELEVENEEVRSMMETQSVEFEKSASEIASIETLKRDADRALMQSEAQTTAMREALVGEISRLTAQLSKYSKEMEELQEERNSFEVENAKLHEDLTLARRDAERARLEGTMSSEDIAKRLHETEMRLTTELDELQHKFEIERNVVDQQKAHIDNLESELEGQQEDSEAAARSYEAAISELKSRLETLQSEASQDLGDLQAERDKLQGERNELLQRTERSERTARQLNGELKEIRMDMDALREEYESRVADLNAEIERVREKYEKQLDGKTNESNEQRDRAIVLQKELDEAKKDIDVLEGENADLQETIEAMEKNMEAVRADFSSRTDAARDEAVAQKEEYEEQLEQLKNELDEKNLQLRDLSHQNIAARDTVRKLEQELEVKAIMLDKAEKERQSVTEMYEGRIDRLRTEMQNSKDEHLKEIGGILDENEKLKNELDEERMQKRSAEYRVRRLEEEVGMGKEHLDQAKKNAEKSKDEYEHVMENIMIKVNEAKDEAATMGEEIAELQKQIRKAEFENNRAQDKIAMLTAEKEEAEANVNQFHEQLNSTTQEYETKIDNITMKYLEKIDKLNKEKADVEDQLHNLQDEHEKIGFNMKAMETELSANKFAYERRIENLEKGLENTVEVSDRKIQSLENELNKVHDDYDGLARERQKLTAHVRNLEADLDESNSARQKITEQLNMEREEHDANMDETTANFSQVVDKLMAERKSLTESLNQVESDLADRENHINNLLREINDERKNYEGKISRLSRENDEINRNMLDLSSQKKEAMDKIRGLEEEVSDADGAIDDAKAAIETLLEEKKAADARILELQNERSKADQATDQLRKQMSVLKKEQESKMFKVQEENDELNHSMIVLKVQKKEALEKISSLENEINQAETAIGDAKNALQKLIHDKEEAIRRIENLEEDLEHAQSTIDAMTKSMSEARQEYETKIDSLMSGLATAREVHASRNMASSQGDYSRSTTYSIPERRSQYTRDSYSSSTAIASKSAVEGDKASTRRGSIIIGQSLVPYREENIKTHFEGKNGLAVDIENMTIGSISSELTDVDRSSVSSSLAQLSKYASGRSRSVGRSRSAVKSGSFHGDERNSTGDSKKSASTPPSHSRTDSKQSNLDLARTFLSESEVGGNNATSRARSRSRPRYPQDRDSFDDSKSVGGQSLAGSSSIYNDSKSRAGSKGFGGKYEGDLNSRGERDGYGVFVADNGNEYEGEWKNDKRNGHGKAKYNTGDVYIGSWRNCKRHGHGTMHIENGDVYDGGWNNGFKDGPGTYRWRDGEVDVSRYSSDYRVGEGVRWSADRKRAFRLIRGNVQDEIDLDEADRIAANLGLPPP